MAEIDGLEAYKKMIINSEGRKKYAEAWERIFGNKKQLNTNVIKQTNEKINEIN